jgi:hypothetical protein
MPHISIKWTCLLLAELVCLLPGYSAVPWDVLHVDFEKAQHSVVFQQCD